MYIYIKGACMKKDTESNQRQGPQMPFALSKEHKVPNKQASTDWTPTGLHLPSLSLLYPILASIPPNP